MLSTATAHYHLGQHPKPEYDASGHTIHDSSTWRLACRDLECLVIWWDKASDRSTSPPLYLFTISLSPLTYFMLSRPYTPLPAVVYEETFQVLDFESIWEHTSYMKEGPLSTEFCTVPASLTYNSREGFDANVFWSVAVMMHTLGTTGLKSWDEELQTLLAVPTDSPLPFRKPSIPPALPPSTPITPDTYHQIRAHRLREKADWKDEWDGLCRVVEVCKTTGNKAFRAGDYETAVEQYSIAISTCDGRNVSVAPLHVLFANRAAAQLKLKRFEGAAEDAAESVERAPLWAKSHFRLACAFRELGKYEEAIGALHNLLAFEPNNPTAQREVADIQLMMRRKAEGSKGTGDEDAVPSSGDDAEKDDGQKKEAGD